MVRKGEIACNIDSWDQIFKSQNEISKTQTKMIKGQT